MDVSSYMSQHREALFIAQRLQLKLCEKQPPADDIAAILTELAGKLKFHLAMEDKYVYPKALSSSHPDLQATAHKMQTEMAGISDAFLNYLATWNISAIAGDTRKFTDETNAMLAALKKRIDLEERTLYPLVHRHL